MGPLCTPPGPGVLLLISPAISEADASVGRPSPVERARVNPLLPLPEIGSDDRLLPIPVERLVPGNPAVLRPIVVVRGPLSPPLAEPIRPAPKPAGACGPAITNAPPCSASSDPGGNAAAIVERPTGKRVVPSAENPASRPSLAAGSDTPPAARPTVPLPDPVPRTDISRAGEGADPPPVPLPPCVPTVPAMPLVERCTDDAFGPEASTLLPDARLDPADATATSPARVPPPPLGACLCPVRPAPLATGELTASPS